VLLKQLIKCPICGHELLRTSKIRKNQWSLDGFSESELRAIKEGKGEGYVCLSGEMLHSDDKGDGFCFIILNGEWYVFDLTWFKLRNIPEKVVFT